MNVPPVCRPHTSTPSSNTILSRDLSDSDSEGSDPDLAVDEVDIDEHSEDEDDRAAHEFLRATPTATDVFTDGPQAILPYNHHGFAELGRDGSVLQAHYAWNRTPKAPAPSRIQRVPSVNLPPPPPPPLPPPPPQEDPESNSRTLGSYPPQWQEVIGYAKLSFRAYVAGTNGFPDSLSGVEEARECLDDALAVHLEGGGAVEPGKSNTNART